MSQERSGSQGATRREFMKRSSAVVAAAAAANVAIAPRAYAGNNETLRIGLVGCGGRGGGAAVNALSADSNTKLVALADVFSDRLEAARKNLKNSHVGARVEVDDEHCFTGLDGYKGVIESCDVVLLATPPGFRPMHIEAAVAAGRHIFAEKPVAVDGPGVRRVLEACRKAKEKNLTVVSGLCYRYEFAKQETIKRIHDGEIGDITAMQTTYNTGALWHRGRNPNWTEMEYQLRNWLYFTWLSGDFNNEQHVHSLDKIAWAMKDEYPVKCTASGGRTVRTDPMYGDVYDHFNTVYEWKNGVRCFSSCRQWHNCTNDVSDFCFGTKGTAAIQGHVIAKHNGETWRHRRGGADDMYQNEHNAMFAAIRQNETINNGEYMCYSTMMAIMARMSAYTGREVTWQMAMESKLDLSPQAYDLNAPAPEVKIAVPGQTSFA